MADVYIYDMAATWNNGATAFDAIKMNVTDTASAAASKLLNLQLGGTTKFGVQKDANFLIAAGRISSIGDGRILIGPNGNPDRGISFDDRSIAIGVGGNMSWSNSLNPIANGLGGNIVSEVAAFPSDNYTLAMRNATNSMTFRVYDTITDVSNYARQAMTFVSGVATMLTEGVGTSTQPDFKIDSGNRKPYSISPADLADMAVSFGMMDPP